MSHRSVVVVVVDCEVDTRHSALSIFRDRNRNRDCNRVVETRVVDHNHVGDNRDGTVSVIRNREMVVVVDLRTVGAGVSIVDNFLIRLLLHFPCPYFWRSSR